MSGKPAILVGTSGFAAPGWVDSFYPANMMPADFLAFYATRFITVEIGSTFYRAPDSATVREWARKTPEHFVFALKVPRQFTHENCLDGSYKEFGSFVETAALLGNKLGPMLFQFPYFSPGVFRNGADFLARFKPLLKRLPKDYKFAAEFRNGDWLNARFADALREYRVALVLQDRKSMPGPGALFQNFDPITADFAYVRWLGDRQSIEQRTNTWNQTIIDRGQELRNWVGVCDRIRKRGVSIYAYSSNYYAGHAPATVELFLEMWRAKVMAEIGSHSSRSNYEVVRARATSA